MNYRAQLMGGSLKIDSPKGGGTRVSCYLPNDSQGQTKARKRAGQSNRLRNLAKAPAAANLNFQHLEDLPSGEYLLGDKMTRRSGISTIPKSVLTTPMRITRMAAS